MNFKPTFLKTLLSVLVVVSNYIYGMVTINNICLLANVTCSCEKGFSFISDCCGCFADLLTLLNQLFNFLLPGIVIYVVFSLFENIKRKRKVIKKTLKRKLKKRGKK